MAKPKRKKQGSMSLHWMVTDFGAKDGKRREVKDWEAKGLTAEWADNVEYFIIGMEICPKTKTPHGQGYIKLTERRRMDPLKAILGLPAVNLQVKRGTVKQAIDYCEKKNDKVDGLIKDAVDIYEYGERPKEKGKRADLDRVIEIINEGGQTIDIINECPREFIKFHGGIGKMINIKEAAKAAVTKRKVTSWVFWGLTGTGKTTAAMAFEQSWNDIYVMHGDSMAKDWWDGYTGQKTLVLDEWNSSSTTVTRMNNLLDKIPCRLPTKGGHTYAQWTTVIITTNSTWPEEVYAGPRVDPKRRDAFLRRIKTAFEFAGHWRERTPLIMDSGSESEDGNEEEKQEQMPDKPALVRQHGFVFDD